MTTLPGCCVCSDHADTCVDATAYTCPTWPRNHSSCVFVAGGHCQMEQCVGGEATGTPTSVRTPRKTRTATSTHTNTPVATSTPTETPTGAPSDTPVATATDTQTPSEGAGASATPSVTETPTPESTATQTGTPMSSATETGTPESTATPTGTPSSVTETATPESSATATATPTPPCRAAPVPECRRPSPPNSWVVRLKDGTDRTDRLVWKWRGASGGLFEFGDPVTRTDYTICIYAGTTAALVMQATAPHGGTCGTRPCWVKRKERRFKYVDRDLAPDGLARIVLRTRPSVARANLVVVGRGPLLSLPDLPILQPVLVQLVKSDGSPCWEAMYSAPALKNTKKEFKDKND
jgi:hypothetical protein